MCPPEISVLKANSQYHGISRTSQVALVVKKPPASEGDIRDVGSISGSGRSPGEGNGNPLQYSYLEYSMNRGAWQATVHGVTISQTQLSTHTHIHTSGVCNSAWHVEGVQHIFVE